MCQDKWARLFQFTGYINAKRITCKYSKVSPSFIPDPNDDGNWNNCWLMIRGELRRSFKLLPLFSLLNLKLSFDEKKHVRSLRFVLDIEVIAWGRKCRKQMLVYWTQPLVNRTWHWLEVENNHLNRDEHKITSLTQHHWPTPPLFNDAQIEVWLICSSREDQSSRFCFCSFVREFLFSW